MAFVLLKSFSNYVDANIALGVLQQEGINCHLEDEHIVTLINMASGIRLMVHHSQLDRASAILRETAKPLCPECGGEMVIPGEEEPEKRRSVLKSLRALFKKTVPDHTTYRCVNCGRKFDLSS